MSWGRQVAVAFDQFIGVVFGITRPGETISSRAGMAAREGKRWGCVLCWFLNKIDPNHCEGAITNDLLRAEKVESDL